MPVNDQNAPPGPADLAADAALLEDAVRAAGAAALAHYGKSPRSWTKEFNSPVSEADLIADNLLHAALCGARPGYGWLSEESGRDNGHGGIAHGDSPVWIVDPIDGTRAFLKTLPEWTVSVALVSDGKPVLAAVYNPVREELFTARRGGGAALNGAPIAASGRADIAGAKLIAYENSLRGKKWRADWPKCEVAQVGSMAYRLCLVAAGQWDATISVSAKSDWDLAAADLIMSEAGGIASTFLGAPFVYNKADFRHPNVIGAGKALHGILKDHIDATFIP